LERVIAFTVCWCADRALHSGILVDKAETNAGKTRSRPENETGQADVKAPRIEWVSNPEIAAKDDSNSRWMISTSTALRRNANDTFNVTRLAPLPKRAIGALASVLQALIRITA
jgi:hypothetical protein